MMLYGKKYTLFPSLLLPLEYRTKYGRGETCGPSHEWININGRAISKNANENVNREKLRPERQPRPSRNYLISSDDIWRRRL